MRCRIEAEKEIRCTLKIRIPWWASGGMTVSIDNKTVEYTNSNGYMIIDRVWENNSVVFSIPMKITCWPLPDEPHTVAFMEGPVVLAGLVDDERLVHGDINYPETMLEKMHERQWSDWMTLYKTKGQMNGFYFKPLKYIGNQRYTVYFPIKESFT